MAVAGGSCGVASAALGVKTPAGDALSVTFGTAGGVADGTVPLEQPKASAARTAAATTKAICLSNWIRFSRSVNDAGASES